MLTALVIDPWKSPVLEMSKPIEVFKFEIDGREVIGLRFDRNPIINNELDKRIRKYSKGVADPGGWSQDQDARYVDAGIWNKIRSYLAKRFDLVEANE
jgi:hypothetical protein